MLQLLLIAARNLVQHRRRTLLLGGAIGAVTALLVILIELSTGLRATILRSATTLMTGHVNVAGFYKVTPGQSAPVVTQYEKVLATVRQTVPEIDYIVERGRGWAKVISDTGSVQVGLGGVDIEHEPGLHKVLRIVQGNLDELAQPNTILIFEDQAKKLDVKVGDTLTISAPTPRGTNNTLDLRVVAIAKDLGLLSAFNVFMPATSLRALYQFREDSTGALMVYLKNIRLVPAVHTRLRNALQKAGYTMMDEDPKPFWQKFESVNREDWTGQRLDITNWDDEVSFVMYTVTALDVLTGALTFILLVIIAVGVMNTMWIAIRERTREIGTLRAIGMQRARVLWMFVTEAFVLGLSATVSGAVLGMLICALLNAAHISVPIGVQLFLMNDRLTLLADPVKIFLSVLFITFCTSAISLIPSLLAARMKPITAMHYIG
ncbi:MAG TPA: FtsX-like permease family protein [Myxococcaceae bacterium]|nr:FtsX-like permease family protein [Myxococcaceae bacterium]